MEPLRARLFGRPVFEAGGKLLPCPSRKAICLAARVLLGRAGQPRGALAAMLWGADSPRHALGSLRVALTKLPTPVLTCLDVKRDSIGTAVDAVVEVDVEEFVAGCASEDADAQLRALALYTGDLLQGAEEEAAPEFADWLLPERARLRQLAHDAHLRAAQRLAAHGERARARDIADAWFRHDPAAEEMHRLVMGWLTGDQALAQYEVYRRARAVVHGAPPSESMAALAERLRHGAERAARDVPARLTAATSFIGRADELAELRALLADPACRLLTLHGLGGVGKTRLASALAEMEAGAFTDGVFVVALDGVPSAALFAQTLARACGLQPAGSAAPLDLVASFLQDRAALVVLDNLEHLLDSADDDPQSLPAQVAALLRGTGERVKVLATSREPLRLQEEWLYQLSGLAHPRSGAEGEGDGQRYAAVQFFAARARQAYLGFSLAAEMPSVLQICEMLEGLPLGLELAASWVRSVPCAEIAAGLRSSAQELRNRHANRASRHDSLGAVVAYSWDRLPLEQREALSGLAALRGTFSREAAEFVAHAALRTLSALTEKSLLQRAAGGRWHLHEVVRQFAWDPPDTAQKARPSRQAAACKRRDAFYMELLRGSRARLDGAEEPEMLGAIEAEGANIREAWLSCARLGALDALETAAPAWFEFLEARSFVAEGVAAANDWLQAARAAGNSLSTGRALVRLGLFQRFAAQPASALESLDAAIAILEPLAAAGELANARVARAFTLFLLGRLDDAEREANVALVLGEARGEPATIAAGCRVKGLVLMQSGRREEGRDLQRRALDVATRFGKPSLQAAAHNNLALAENHLGNFRAAEAGYESALALWRDLHMTVNVGRGMHNLGVVATRVGDHGSALARYRAAREVLLKAGDRNLIALNLMSTGDALVRLGRPEEARAPLRQALRMAERDGHALPALDSHIVLAQAALDLGELPEAAQHLAAALDGARERHFANVLADAVVNAARLIATRPAERARAAAWARDIARLPDTSVSVRQDAEALIAALGSAPAPTDAPRPLQELVAEVRAAIATLNAPRDAPVAAR